MKIKAAFKIINEIRFLRSVLKNYGNSLMPGKYYLFDGFRALSLNDQKTKEIALKYFDKPGKNRRMANIAKKLNKIGYFKNRNKRSSKEYEAFYTANNYDKVREIKLFSFERGKILTVCTSNENMQIQLDQYQTFSPAYPLPSVRKSEKYKNSFEISMINILPFPGDFSALLSISEATANNLSFIQKDELQRKKASELISFSYSNETINKVLESIIGKIDPTVLALDFPIILQHGDLSKDNLLYGISDNKTDFWWIDWEHAEKRIFFYDYFFYIINSAIYEDFGPYNSYISNESDKYLSIFFHSFGLLYNPSLKKDYLLLFSTVFLKERVCDLGNVSALQKYYNLLINM